MESREKPLQMSSFVRFARIRREAGRLHVSKSIVTSNGTVVSCVMTAKTSRNSRTTHMKRMSIHNMHALTHIRVLQLWKGSRDTQSYTHFGHLRCDSCNIRDMVMHVGREVSHSPLSSSPPSCFLPVQVVVNLLSLYFCNWRTSRDVLLFDYRHRMPAVTQFLLPFFFLLFPW